MRVCKQCKLALPPEAFQVERRVRDGRRSVCKLCTRAKLRGRHTGGQHRSKSKDKRGARQRVTYAVKVGKIVKPDRCERCGDMTPRHLLDGHHADYSKPLDVQWLCRPCHGLEALTWKIAI